ncbi:MAG: hypothetical protein WCE30_11455 [Mycobacterium sp.]
MPIRSHHLPITTLNVTLTGLIPAGLQSVPMQLASVPADLASRLDPLVKMLTELAAAAVRLALVSVGVSDAAGNRHHRVGDVSQVTGERAGDSPTSAAPPAAVPPPPLRRTPDTFAAGNDLGIEPSFRAGYGDYLRTAGLGEVAAVAVPGFTGILVLTGAGGLLGYRQARAGHALRSRGTARFVS